MSVDISTIGLDFDVTGMQRGVRVLIEVHNHSNNAANAADRASGRFSALDSTLGMLKGTIAALGIGVMANEFVKASDSVALMDARLKLAMGSQKDFEQAQKDVYAIAQKNNISLGSAASLYTKLADPVRDAGGSIREVRGIVDAFSTTLRISGATTEEASSATLQFAQAMASGKLQGDEFKSLAETAPRFMKALAEGMNMPVGKLKEMGSEGKLTADVVGNALINSLDKLNKEAATLPQTSGGAFQQFKNDMLEAVRVINSDTNITSGVVDIIGTARALIPVVRDELMHAFEAVAAFTEKNAGNLGEMWDNAKHLTAEVWELVKGAAAVGGAIIQWGVESGTFNKVITGARFLVAGFEDGVKLVSAALVGAGADIIRWITNPLRATLEIAGQIAGYFGKDLSAKIKELTDPLDKLGRGADKFSGSIYDAFAKGDTAVNRLITSLNVSEAVTKSTGKAANDAAEAYKKLIPVNAGPDKHALAAANVEMQKQKKLVLELAGLAPTFLQDWDRLTKMYQSHKISLVDLTKEQEKLLAKQPAMKEAIKEQAEAQKEAMEFEKRYMEGMSASSAGIMQDKVDDAEAEAKANEELAKTYGMTKSAIEAMQAARYSDMLAHKSEYALTLDQIEALEKLVAIKTRNSAALAAMEGDKFGAKEAKDYLDIVQALDQATQQAAQGMAQSFGAIGASIGSLTTALSGYATTSAAIEAQRLASIAAAAGTQQQIASKIADANAKAARSSAQAQIKSYGDMAGAAKGFFKENTTGYKVMENVEKTYRAFEMAMAIANMAEKMGLVTTYTAAVVVGKEAETAAAVASVGPDVAASMAKGQAAAAAGVAGQAQGDPYTAWARMAAMAVAMATLGFAVSGGGKSSVNVSQQRQTSQGTGSVLGDSAAKSNSIARAVELSASNSSTQINYLAGMLMTLRSIETNIGSFASQLVQSGAVDGSGVTTKNGGVYDALNSKAAGGLGSIAGAGVGYMAGAGFSAFTSLAALGGPIGLVVGAIAGKYLGKALNSIMGGKQTLQDSGFTMDKESLASITATGANAKSYAEIKTDGGWFRSDKTNTSKTDLSADANRQFSLIISSLAESVSQAGKLLGVSGDSFTARLNNFVVDIGQISLKGLSGDEVQKQLEAVFSKLGDDMAAWAVGGLQQFQKVGEGYLETLVRLATDYAKVDASLQSMGMTMGATGLSSLAAREDLISLMGGIDKLGDSAASFGQNFLTKAEQMAPVAKYVTEQLSAMGLGFIDTRDEFKSYVLGLKLTVDSERQQYAALMSLQDAFAATHAATVDLTKSEQDIADERKSLQDQLDELMMTNAQLLTKQRAALDPSNRALFDQIQRVKELQAAQDASKDSLSSLITNMTSFKDSTRKLTDSLAVSTLTTLTPEAQLEELRRQYDDTKTKAMAGDTAAQGQYSSAATAFLTMSQKLNGGDASYLADYAGVQADAKYLEQWATGQVDTAQAQLDAMKNQIAGLETLNDTATKIWLNLDKLPSALVSFGLSFSSTRLANDAALSDEVRAMRQSNEVVAAKVEALQTQQSKETGAMIDSNLKAQSKAADAIVSGFKGILSSVYKQANSSEDVFQ